jgi:hypothetical protein
MSAHRAYVEGLVPFVHVRDVMRSTAFYEQFGFEVHNTYEEGGRRVWCWLERHQARLMLAHADAPVVASEQAVLFYVYAYELEELHSRLAEAGLEPGPIEPERPALTASSVSRTRTATASWSPTRRRWHLHEPSQWRNAWGSPTSVPRLPLRSIRKSRAPLPVGESDLAFVAVELGARERIVAVARARA